MREIKNDVAPKGRHQINQHHNNITKETRQEAFVARPVTRAVDILRVLGQRELTAREIAWELGFTERNATAPRLTELRDLGLVEVVGKKKDNVTGKSVALWRKVT